MSTRLKKLKINNFRNFEKLSYEFNDRPIIWIYGNNGVGKTNLLEAISLLIPGKGLRGAKLEDLVNAKNKTSQNSSELQHANSQTNNGWVIFAKLEDDRKLGEFTIGTAFSPQINKKRQIKIDGKDVKAQADLADYISIFSLMPNDDMLLSESSGDKRRFYDRICANFFSDYDKLLNEYESLKFQRSKLLKSPKQDNNWLTVIEGQMADKAIIIAKYRKMVIEGISDILHEDIIKDFCHITIDIQGFAEDRITSEINNIGLIKDDFCEIMYKFREMDMLSNRTNEGIHRSQLQVCFDEKIIHGVGQDVSLCSTGEQKKCLITIILAAAILKKQWHGISSILLLDEVTSHFDKKRAEQLLQLITRLDLQAFITATDQANTSTEIAGQLSEIEI